MTRIWKALAFLAAMAAALALSTSAFAAGGGSSSSPARWRISVGPAGWSGRLTALYPGVRGDTELLLFTVTNAGQAKQRLGRAVTSISATARGGARTAGGAAIGGCRADWFTVALDRANHPLPVQLAPGASYRGTIELSMRDSGTNQDACKGASPAIAVAAG